MNRVVRRCFLLGNELVPMEPRWGTDFRATITQGALARPWAVGFNGVAVLKATIADIATGADIAEGALARVSANVFTVKRLYSKAQGRVSAPHRHQVKD